MGRLRATLSTRDNYVHIICEDGHHHAFDARTLLPFREELDACVDRRLMLGVCKPADMKDHGDESDEKTVTLVQAILRRYWPAAEHPMDVVEWNDAMVAAAWSVVRALRQAS